jgi:hypothetical protein
MTVRQKPFGHHVGYQRTAHTAVTTPEELRSFAETPPIYLGFVQLIDFNTNNATGVRSKFKLLDIEGFMSHPFDGLRWSRKAGDGQRFKITVNRPIDEGPDGFIYTGEVTLGWWASDCESGASVTFRSGEDLDEAGKRHPLSEVPTEKDLRENLSLCCWAIGDDEMAVAPTHSRRGPKIPFAAMDATRQAGIKCGDTEFREWCHRAGVLHLARINPEAAAALPPFEVDAAGFAEGIVRGLCEVPSRSDLKKAGPDGDAARRRWTRILRLFGLWRAERRVPSPTA